METREAWRTLAPLGAQVEVFEVFGKHLCFNATTCAFLEVDPLTASVLRHLRAGASYEQASRETGGADAPQAFDEVIEELAWLAQEGYLSDSDRLLSQRRSTISPLSALCFIMATDCNLRCRYCYAGDGSYQQPRQIMSVETARAAVDFLLRKSRRLKEVGVGFFGGEPLLNYRCMTEVVPYAEEAARRCGKQCSFSITTNGTLLTPEKVGFFEEHGFAYIVSLDGAKERNDRNRVFRNGAGSYDEIVKRLREIAGRFPAFAGKVTIRATFTGRDHDLAGSLAHLRDLGFSRVSVEPCSAMSALGGIAEEDLPGILADYDAAAQWYLKLLGDGGEFSFFHMQQMFSQVAKGEKRTTQCGAGCGYMAVAPDGTLYPCHRLVGAEGLAMGSVFTHARPEIQSLFTHASVPYKEKCRACWARYICGGGCHATALQFNGNILEPHQTECAMMKHRIRLGAWLYSQLSAGQSSALMEENACGLGFPSATGRSVPATPAEASEPRTADDREPSAEATGTP